MMNGKHDGMLSTAFPFFPLAATVSVVDELRREMDRMFGDLERPIAFAPGRVGSHLEGVDLEVRAS